MKKIIKLHLSLFTKILFLLISYASGDSESDKKKECSSSNEGYKIGYEAGKTSLWSTPEAFKKNCNRGYGMIGEVPECWDEGFVDGYNSK
jgi:hypothetical protein